MYSLSIHGQQENELDAANGNRKKLMIGGAALLVVGSIGGIIWYNSKFAGGTVSVTKPPAGGSLNLGKVVEEAKLKPLIEVEVRKQEHHNDGEEKNPEHHKEVEEEELTLHKDGEEAKPKTVFPKTLAECGSNPRALFKTLQKFRSEMPPESQCVVPDGEAPTAGKPHKLQIANGANLTTAHCPDGFTLNSVWWASPKMENAAFFIRDGYIHILEMDLELDGTENKDHQLISFIWEQNQKLGNIPGTNNIPLRPQLLANKADLVNTFHNEFDAWHRWATKDQECKLAAEDLPLSDSVTVSLFWQGLSESVKLKCQSKNPTLRSVYSALVGMDKLKGKQLRVYRTLNTYYAEEMHVVEENRMYLWYMYEPFTFI